MFVGGVGGTERKKNKEGKRKKGATDWLNDDKGGGGGILFNNYYYVHSLAFGRILLPTSRDLRSQAAHSSKTLLFSVTQKKEKNKDRHITVEQCSPTVRGDKGDTDKHIIACHFRIHIFHAHIYIAPILDEQSYCCNSLVTTRHRIYHISDRPTEKDLNHLHTHWLDRGKAVPRP